ncbi:MAG: PHP domain-containing protein [Nocardioidaceae bacterium]
MRIDLHTHSDRSDGTLSPAELVGAAARAGLDVVAITDHDCFAGWAEAIRAGREHGVKVLRGVEVSTRFRGASVHLLGYLPDPAYEPLTAELDAILAGRNDRMPQIVGRLQDLGIAITEADVAAVSGEAAASGRPHVADALVGLGVVTSRDEAFARYLGPSGPAYVDRYAAGLERMIELIREAGGVSVVAHPWGRYEHRGLDAEGFAELRALGLDGIEVDHQDHDAPTRDRLRALATDLDLIVTGSSDFHGAGKVGHELGCNTTAPEQLEHLLDAARRHAAASGRGVSAFEGI